MTEQENAKGLLNTDLMTAIYRLAVVILLAGILVVQWQVLGTIDTASVGGSDGPTLGDLRNSAGDRQARQAIINQVPLVRIQGGNVTVSGTVGIDSVSVAQMGGR